MSFGSFDAFDRGVVCGFARRVSGRHGKVPREFR
jgi:hypothetical protein